MSWTKKFRVAITGTFVAITTQVSFAVHGCFAIAVTAIGLWLGLSIAHWGVLLLAMALVLTAEMFNTSIELLVKSLHPRHDAQVGLALDIAAGAVLVASLFAVIVGLMILGPPLWSILR